MKIERIIDGKKVSIELTETELFRAYSEQKKNFEKDFVQNIFDENDFDYTDNELDYVSTLILDKLNYDSIGKQETEMAINYIKRRSIYEYD